MAFTHTVSPKGQLRVLLSGLAILTVLACSVGIGTSGLNVTTALIGDAWMATDETGEQRTSVYSEDATFFVFMELEEAPDGADIEVRWNELDALGPGVHQVLTRTSIHAPNEGTYYFYLASETLWSVASYSVHIYLDGNFAQELSFAVE
ncbi:MAG: hypothetical protein GTO14_20900 [Anaerolineales bacterium]|nr:hypothetical protein [Anaerolineales bacterium]